MGISVSSTQTHERLLLKRAIRKQKLYEKNDPTIQNASPTFIPMQGVKKSPGQDSNKMHEIKNFENLEITLKTNPKKYGEYQKIVTPREQQQSLEKKETLKGETPSNPHQRLSVRQQPEGHAASRQSSLQEINFVQNTEANQLRISPINITSFRTIGSNPLDLSTTNRNNEFSNEPHPNQENNEIHKQMSKKKIEEVKKYIESSAYPSKSTLSNAVYQQNPKQSIDTIAPNNSYSPKKQLKTVSKNSDDGNTVKLKTDEDHIDQSKGSKKNYKPSGPLLKNNSSKVVGYSSFYLDKKKSLV